MSGEQAPQDIPLSTEDYRIFDGAVRDEFGSPIQEVEGRQTKLDALEVGLTEVAAAKLAYITAPEALSPDRGANQSEETPSFELEGEQLAKQIVKGAKRRLIAQNRDIRLIVKPPIGKTEDETTTTTSEPKVVAVISR